MHAHTHTPLCGYRSSTGPTEGLISWRSRNRSFPRQPATTKRTITMSFHHHLSTHAPMCVVSSLFPVYFSSQIKTFLGSRERVRGLTSHLSRNRSFRGWLVQAIQPSDPCAANTSVDLEVVPITIKKFSSNNTCRLTLHEWCFTRAVTQRLLGLATAICSGEWRLWFSTLTSLPAPISISITSTRSLNQSHSS